MERVIVEMRQIALKQNRQYQNTMESVKNSKTK